jgi:hypothetical protein
MIDTWKKRCEDEEEYIPGAFGAARMGAQAMAERQSRSASPAVYRAPKTTQQRYADIDSRIADYTYQKFVESDDYASLVKRYSKQGLRAMDDTLGRVAARTGGIASSYATTAGQQAYGGYMADLEGIARDMYESNKAEMMDERERLYDMQRQERSDALDLYKLRMSQDDTDYDRKNAMAKILAGYGDFSLYEELGLNKNQVGNMKAAWDKAQQVETLKALKLADDTVDDNEPAPSDDEIKEQQQTDYDQAVYEAVYETIKKADPERGQNIAKMITTPEDWAADKQGYRTYSDYLTAELKKIGLDVSPIIKNLGTQQTQSGSDAYGVDEYLRTIKDLYNSEGVDAVMDEFVSLLDEKPEDLTYDEWEKVLNYLKTLR